MSLFDDSTTEHKISKLSFHVLSPEQIDRLSVLSLDSKTLYDIESRRPHVGGPLDLRLGVSTKTGTCATCKENIHGCVGHFGQIKLVLPCFHIGFLKHTLSILNCICKRCASLLCSFSKKMSHRVTGRVSFDAVRAECRTVKACPKCGAPNGLVKKSGGFRVYHEVKRSSEPSMPSMAMASSMPSMASPTMPMSSSISPLSNNVEINPQTCLNLFSLIKEEDYEFLNIKESPTNLIIQTILVSPACIRPSVDMQEEGFNEDDMTVKLSEIVNTNKLLEESIKKGNSLTIINEDWDYLQLQISLLINSDLPSINMTGTPIRGLVQRLKGKSGRFRCNLSGKRVDFSGRTVISPDPNLGIEEVGVPEHIAKILTVPERVNQINQARLSKMVKNGVSIWPGANFIISIDEKGREFKRFLMYGKTKELKVGDVVERHLLDGDILLFNRQPSLHRMSIMGHKAKMHKHRTLRFNECVCSPYNADFDGDEMNIHLPQTVQARAEAEELLGVEHNICTVRNGEPLISCTQDFITGAYLITSKGVFFNREKFSQLCSYAAGKKFHSIKVEPVILSPVELFSGKQVFDYIISLSIQRNEIRSLNRIDENFDQNFTDTPLITLHAKSRSFISLNHPNDAFVQIFNNKLIRGRIDKAIIGGENRKGSLIYQLLKYSKRSAVLAMNAISRLSSRYLAERGFSIGLDDVFPGEGLLKEKGEIIERVYGEVDGIINGRSDNNEINNKIKISDKLNHNINNKIKTTIEPRLEILNQIREECGSLCLRELGPLNSPVIMQECGSKGSKINVAQMIACVGQQIVSDRRIQEGMISRTLPHFPIHSLSPESRGFVLNSFFSGLTSYEFFFHAVSGREGLVDTAVKTAETGYMQRRLMKALEDLSIKYDHTVRNSGEEIVQFAYGEDGGQTLRDEGEEFFEWVFDESVSASSSGARSSASVASRDASAASESARARQADARQADTARDSARDSAASYADPTVQGYASASVTDNTPAGGSNAGNITVIPYAAVREAVVRVLCPSDEISLPKETTGIPLSTTGISFSTLSTLSTLPLISTLFSSLLANPITRPLINQKFILSLLSFLDEAKSRSNGNILYLENPSFIEIFFKTLFRRICNKIADPGTAVGAIAGQSIGEPGTQMTLKTFHFSGVASMDVTLGVPRLKEIINATVNISTPIIRAKLRQDKVTSKVTSGASDTAASVARSNASAARQADPSAARDEGRASAARDSARARHVDPRDTAASSSAGADSARARQADARDTADARYADHNTLAHTVRGRIERILFKDIVSHISQVTAPDRISLHFTVDRSTIEALSLELSLDQLGTLLTGALKGPPLEVTGDGLTYSIKRVKENSFFQIERVKKQLLNTKISGIEGVSRIVINNSNSNTFTNNDNLPELLIEGKSLNKILTTSGVEPLSSSTNDILEVERTLGIEAARCLIMKEVQYTMGKYGIKVDHRHIMLLADTMASKGAILGITRFGIGKMRASTLMLASFEQTADYLFNAAVKGVEEAVSGVSESIILGIPIGLGTGAMGVYLKGDDDERKTTVA